MKRCAGAGLLVRLGGYLQNFVQASRDKQPIISGHKLDACNGVPVTALRRDKVRMPRKAEAACHDPSRTAFPHWRSWCRCFEAQRMQNASRRSACTARAQFAQSVLIGGLQLGGVMERLCTVDTGGNGFPHHADLSGFLCTKPMGWTFGSGPNPPFKFQASSAARSYKAIVQSLLLLSKYRLHCTSPSKH